MPVWVYGYAPLDGRDELANAAQSLYRSFIDAGADIVVGAYPEKVQRVEAYNGRLIVYSVGSFISDVNGPELQRSFGLSITATIPVSQSTTLWARLDCKKYKDDCIAKAAEQGLYKTKPTYEFDVIASDSTAGSVTKLADIDWQKDMVRRLDWDNVVNKLTP